MTLTSLDPVVNVLKEDARRLDKLDADQSVVSPEESREELEYVVLNEVAAQA